MPTASQFGDLSVLSTRLMRWAGLAVITFALIVMAGWGYGSTALTQGGPGLPSLKFNTALCFLMLGITLSGRAGWGRRRLPYRAALGLCLLVLALVGVIMLQYPLGRSFGIDEWLIADPDNSRGSWPGRMLPAAGLGLALSALGCAIATHPRQTALMSRLVCVAGLLAAWVGLHALLQIPLRMASGLPLNNSLSIGIYTALALFAMGTALFFRGVSIPPQSMRQHLSWLPLLTFLITLSIPFNLAQLLADQQAADALQGAEEARDRIVSNIRAGIDQPVLALQRMADRAPLYLRPWRSELWSDDAGRYLRDYRALRAIAVVGPDHIIQKRVPMSARAREGGRVDFDPTRREVLRRAQQQRGPQLSRAAELMEGGTGTVIVAPGFVGNEHIANIVATAQFAQLLEPVLSGVAVHYNIRVHENNLLLYGRSASAPVTAPELLMRAGLNLYGTRWQVEVWPGPGAPGAKPSPLPSMIMVAGAIAALLIALALRLAMLARWQRLVAEQSFASAQHAEEVMRASRERFEAVAQATSDALWDWDLIHNTVWRNEGFETLFGFPRNQLESGGSPSIERIHPDDRVRVMAGIHDAIAGGALHWRAEYRYALANGDWADVIDRAMIVRESGRAVRMVGGMSDITARKASERALRDRDRFFEVSLELLAIVAPTGEILQVNPAFEKLLGWTRAEVLATPFFDLIHPDDLPVTRAALARLMKGDAVNDFEIRIRCKSGSYRWMQWNIVPSADNLLYGAGRDITTRRNAESDLRQVVQRLESNNRELQAFSQVAARDLQDPLRKVRSYLAKVGGPGTSTPDAEAERATGAAERMQALVTGLISYSRIISDGRPLIALELTEIVTQVLEELADPIKLAGGRIEVGELPLIRADPVQMRQLFLLLIGNGLRFHRAGTPQIRISATAIAESLDAPTPLTRILVEERCIGFSESFAEGVSMPGEHVRGRGDFEGSGIAMAIMQRIVDRHHGSMVIHGDARSGMRFELRLPVDHADHPRSGAEGTPLSEG